MSPWYCCTILWFRRRSPKPGGTVDRALKDFVVGSASRLN